MIRLAALGMSHETNTFVSAQTDYTAFEHTGILHADEIVGAFKDAHSTMAGYLDAGDGPGVQITPLIFAHATPSGLITRDGFARIADEMIRLLRDHGPWDGVLLAQHGAAVSEEYPDADGEIVSRVRSLVGDHTPVGLSLDMHANVSPKMVENATITVLYRTNPHVDPRLRARECAELVVRTIRGEIRPVQRLETPPVVINILQQHTGSEPMRGIMQDLEEVLRQPGMLSASVAMGYPYADVPEMGMAFLAIHDGDPTAASGAARQMARRAWDKRSHFRGDAPAPNEALRLADDAPAHPVVLMDVGDNVGGGGPGDSTILLTAAKRLRVHGLLYILHDPEAVAACVSAGVRRHITLRVGAKTDGQHGEPVEVTGTVRMIADGRFEERAPRHGGHRFFDAGLTAVLETTDDHTIVLTSKRTMPTSLQQLYSVGIRPEAKRVIVAKGVVAPRAAYEPIAAQIVLVNTPGVTSSDLSGFAYVRRRRPLYPFEPDAVY
ncbi:MAG TPA: M81 family metallopeptidase [bacterium]|nr:M81 family metallopeptidase [bacterium]